jgi:carboxyl-terminal processing protease
MSNFVNKNPLIKFIIFAQALIFIHFPSWAYAKEIENNNYPDSYYFKQFQEVFQKIEKDYMQVPNRQEMTDEAINGMLRSLDPYSGYFTDEDLELFITQTDGEFGGIGVEIMYDQGAVKVITPIDDLPAYKAGIRAGDYIVGVNGQLVSNLGFNKSVKEMRGKPGTKLNILVIKEDENATKEIELSRETVKIKPVKYEIEEDSIGGIGYIRIVAFNNQTNSELKKAFTEIENKLQKNKKTLQGVILDVRNNPGGLLDQAVAVCEYLLDQGTIVSVRGRDDKTNTVISAGRFASKAPKVPMIVLVNSGTASAAEIVAGALQDHKRAIIVGTTSFGKGLVQTFTPINKRAAVKLTTAKYYTPSGKSINAKGIQPDIYIENAKVEYAEKESKDKSFTNSSVKSYLKKYNVEEKPEENKTDHDKEHILSEKYKNDYQYARAYDLIRGLIVSRTK